MGHRQRVALSTIAQTTATVAAAALGVVGLHKATSALGPSGYGTFITVVSFVTLFVTLNDLGLTSVGTRQLARTPEEAPTLLGINFSVRLAMSLALMPLVTAIAFAVYPGRRSTVVEGVALLSIDLVLNSLQTTALTFFAARVRNDLAAIVVLFGKVTYVSLIFVAASSHTSFMGFLIAYLAGDFAGAVLAVVLVMRRVRPTLVFNLGTWADALKQSLPVGVLQVIGMLYLWNGSILLSILRDASSVAYFGLSANVFIIVSSMAGFVMTALLPALATSTLDGVRAYVQSAIDLLTFIAVPVVIVGFALRHDIVVTFGGQGFAPAAMPFGLLMVATGFSFVNSVFGYAAIATERHLDLLRVQLGVLALNLLLGAITSWRYGVAGEAATLLSSEVASTALLALQFRHSYGLALEWRSELRLLAPGAMMIVWLFLLSDFAQFHEMVSRLAIELSGCAIVYVGTAIVTGAIPSDLRKRLR